MGNYKEREKRAKQMDYIKNNIGSKPHIWFCFDLHQELTTCLEKVFASIKAKFRRTYVGTETAQRETSAPPPLPPPTPPFQKKKKKLGYACPLPPSLKTKAYAFIFSPTH